MIYAFGLLLFIAGAFIATQNTSSKVSVPLMIAGLVLVVSHAMAHDASRPELNAWFDQLASKKGPCCSNADGSAVVDADWDSQGGHYRVRIEGEWWDVPENAVITEPNRDGRTIVWPIHLWDGTKHTISIRCFMPGSMT